MRSADPLKEFESFILKTTIFIKISSLRMAEGARLVKRTAIIILTDIFVNFYGFNDLNP